MIALSDFLLDFLKEKYPESLVKRYEVLITGENEEIFQEIAKKRGFLLSKGVLDVERARKLLLNEFKNGQLGRISLDD